MKLSNLPKVKLREKRRVGQGISAGQGKTAGRGTKGQNARTGHKLRPGFEGGQMPLAQRLPKKRGFVARAVKPQTVRIALLELFKDGATVTNASLAELGIVQKGISAKIVNGGKLTKKLTVSVLTTKGAAEAITKAGGKLLK